MLLFTLIFDQFILKPPSWMYLLIQSFLFKLFF